VPSTVEASFTLIRVPTPSFKAPTSTDQMIRGTMSESLVEASSQSVEASMPSAVRPSSSSFEAQPTDGAPAVLSEAAT
jgi:hypothetical protein